MQLINLLDRVYSENAISTKSTDEVFIPLWHINGSPQTNAKYCELFTTFEILIHILSKRFITFKSQLLSISL